MITFFNPLALIEIVMPHGVLVNSVISKHRTSPTVLHAAVSVSPARTMPPTVSFAKGN